MLSSLIETAMMHGKINVINTLTKFIIPNAAILLQTNAFNFLIAAAKDGHTTLVTTLLAINKQLRDYISTNIKEPLVAASKGGNNDVFNEILKHRALKNLNVLSAIDTLASSPSNKHV